MGTCFCYVIAATQVAQRPTLTLEQEEELESRDQALGSLLDRLGGSIHGKTLNVSPSKVCLLQSLTCFFLICSWHNGHCLHDASACSTTGTAEAQVIQHSPSCLNWHTISTRCATIWPTLHWHVCAGHPWHVLPTCRVPPW
jgi:hypothetical protein